MIKRAQRRAALLAGVLALSLTGCGGVMQQSADQSSNYPERSIELIVPFAAGGATDLIARAFAAELESELGSSVVVINQPGGSTTVGASNVANAKPDGYTLFLGTTTTFATTPLMQEVPYKLSDFTGIAGIADQPYIVVSNPAGRYASLDDLPHADKKITYSVAALGNNAHLAVADLLKDVPVQSSAIPFQSSQEMLTAVAGSQVDLAPVDVNVAAPQLEAGTVRGLAVTSKERLEQFPNIPTTQEAAFANTRPFLGRYAILTPDGLPQKVEEKLRTAAKAASSSEVMKAFRAKNYLLSPEFGDGKAWLEEMIPAEREKASAIMKQLGLGLEKKG